MNVIIIGSSATGKSTLLEELKTELGDKADYIDSNKWISKEYDENIYSLFLDKHDPADPVNRKRIIDTIATLEEEFLQYLKKHKGPYVAVIGNNVHTRNGWEDYLASANPDILYLWADPDAVYKGLKLQENDLAPAIKNHDAFGVWNLGITRQYDTVSGKYVELPTRQAKQKVALHIAENMDDYDAMAIDSFAAISLLDWHDKYSEFEKSRFIESVESSIDGG